MSRAFQTRHVVAHVGRRMRALRIAAGLTQKQVSRRCGMKQAFISEMECGKTNPSLASLAVVAQAIGCELADFMVATDRPVLTLSADDAKRVFDAFTVLASVFGRTS